MNNGGQAQPDVAVQIAELRGDMSTKLTGLRGDMQRGFTEISGRLDLIAQAQQGHTRQIEDLDERVTALEARRIPWPLVATLSGAVSALVAALALFVQF